ncbi:MAG: ThiF family adenylyltransferase [Bacteroidia bacterium]|nr:ThiF family adenylyltransferase [Bacteroidia bacterium]
MAENIPFLPQNPRYQSVGKVPGWDLEKIRKATVLVVGAGALGNEVLKNLALLGLGRIIVVDFDRVEVSNLSRSVLYREEDARLGKFKAEVAAQRLKEINPEIKVSFLVGDLGSDVGLGLVRLADAVIGCLDNRLARLYLNRFCYRLGKSWVNGGILNLSGQAEVYRPDKNCYECSITEKGWAEIRHRIGCADIAQRYGNQGIIPTTPISASIIGAIQVQEALKIILNQEEDGLAGTKFYYEGQKVIAGKYQMLPPRQECESHGVIGPLEECPELRSSMSLGDFFSWAEKHFNGAEVVLESDQGLITGLGGLKSGHEVEVFLPKSKFDVELIAQKYNLKTENFGIPPGKLKFSFSIDDIHLMSQSLLQLGFPFMHIIRVLVDGERRFLELTGDRFEFEKSGFHEGLPVWS